MQKVKIDVAEIELTNGTMVRNTNGDVPYYLDIGIMENGNKVLFYYSDASIVVDYIQTIINNLQQMAATYLSNILNTQSNILVRLWTVPGHESCFEIYYDSDCIYDNVIDVISWMGSHNDFACSGYRYTMVRNGHQEICE